MVKFDNIASPLIGVRAKREGASEEIASDGTLRSVNNALDETVLMFSDRIGRLTNQVFADSHTLNLAYDRFNAPEKYILPHGAEHGFGYNPVGQTECYSMPPVDSEPTNIFWRYNSDRQLDHVINPDGTIISNVYDSAGRLVGVRAKREEASEEIVYADDGRVCSVSLAGNAPHFTFDAAGNFLSQQLTADSSPLTTQFAYDGVERDGANEELAFGG